MKKILDILKHKRAQGALVFAITLILKQLGVGTDEASIAQAVLVIIQALSALWGIFGIVDASPGHNKPPA